MPTPVQSYLTALFNKAMEDPAERIEFIPGPGAGMVRYFERHDLCHTLSVPLKLHGEIINQILHLANLQLTAETPQAESWLCLASGAAECRVHVSARPAKAGPMVKLSF